MDSCWRKIFSPRAWRERGCTVKGLLDHQSSGLTSWGVGGPGSTPLWAERQHLFSTACCPHLPLGPPPECRGHVLLSTPSLAACHLDCLAGRDAPYLCAREAQVCLRHSHSVPPAGILAEGGLGMGSTGETVCGIIKKEQNTKQNNVFLPRSFLSLALIIFPL